MSSPVLSGFDPLAVHPFTAGPPTPQSQSLPHRSSPTCLSSVPSSGSSLPSTSRSTAQSDSPGQQQPSRSQIKPLPSQPIFAQFKPERASPELPDLIKKTRASKWPLKPVYPAAKQA